MRRVIGLLALVWILAPAPARAQEYDAAYLTTNPYLGQPVPPYDARVSPYSSQGALNPYTRGGGRIYAQDGTYHGRLNSNRYDSESVANPYGRYGSPYSSESINNPYSQYGSPLVNRPFSAPLLASR
jgi:hypothetical protein